MKHMQSSQLIKKNEATINRQIMSLKGKKVCITGKLTACTRNEAHEIIEKAGGTINKTMASTVDIAIVGVDAGEDKMDKIEKWGIKKWSENAFVKKCKVTPEMLEDLDCNANKKAKTKTKAKAKTSNSKTKTKTKTKSKEKTKTNTKKKGKKRARESSSSESESQSESESESEESNASKSDSNENESDVSDLDEDTVNGMKVQQLKDALHKRHLALDGKKADLQKRLLKAINKKGNSKKKNSKTKTKTKTKKKNKISESESESESESNSEEDDEPPKKKQKISQTQAKAKGKKGKSKSNSNCNSNSKSKSKSKSKSSSKASVSSTKAQKSKSKSKSKSNGKESDSESESSSSSCEEEEEDDDIQISSNKKSNVREKASELASKDVPPNPGVKDPKPQAYKVGQGPYFPSDANDYKLKRFVVLMCTNMGNNNNKYYGLEQHVSNDGNLFRLYTHYGRLDDLAKKPESGMRQCRYYDTQAECDAGFLTIYKQKTSAAKGYKPVNLASSKIGSEKAQGMSAGGVGQRTKQQAKKNEKRREKRERKKEKNKTKTKDKSNNDDSESESESSSESGSSDEDSDIDEKEKDYKLDKHVIDLVEYLYKEAKTRIETTVDCTVTAEGFETTLGVLTMEQIEHGEDILVEIYKLFKDGKTHLQKYDELTNEFYSNVPHKFGGRQNFAHKAKFDSFEKFEEKQDTIQVMKDMLDLNETSVGGSKSKSKNKNKDKTKTKSKKNKGKTSVLTDGCDVYTKYEALNCTIDYLPKTDKEYKYLLNELQTSISRSHGGKIPNIKRVFKICRIEEMKRYNPNKLSNEQILYHGSRPCNWVGILSRGLLLPKIVVSIGINRTDGGWLGDGIYFGDADTASFYAGAGERGCAYFLGAKVALGKMQDVFNITHGLQINKGYHSAHGTPGDSSEFDDNEYCIYDEKQHHLQYFIEFEKDGYGGYV